MTNSKRRRVTVTLAEKRLQDQPFFLCWWRRPYGQRELKVCTGVLKLDGANYFLLADDIQDAKRKCEWRRVTSASRRDLQFCGEDKFLGIE